MPFSLGTVGYTLGVIGEVLIAYTVLKVHKRFMKERMIDNVVLREMKREQGLAYAAIVLIIFGYILKVIAIELDI
jgi:hypothetical protein